VLYVDIGEDPDQVRAWRIYRYPSGIQPMDHQDTLRFRQRHTLLYALEQMYGHLVRGPESEQMKRVCQSILEDEEIGELPPLPLTMEALHEILLVPAHGYEPGGTRELFKSAAQEVDQRLSPEWIIQYGGSPEQAWLESLGIDLAKLLSSRSNVVREWAFERIGRESTEAKPETSRTRKPGGPSAERIGHR